LSYSNANMLCLKDLAAISIGIAINIADRTFSARTTGREQGVHLVSLGAISRYRKYCVPMAMVYKVRCQSELARAYDFQQPHLEQADAEALMGGSQSAREAWLGYQVAK